MDIVVRNGQQYEFKFWTRLIAFHIALIPMGKVQISIFSLQLWVNCRVAGFFILGEETSLGEEKTLNSNLLYSA